MHSATRAMRTCDCCTGNSLARNKIIIAQTNQQVWSYNAMVRRLLHRDSPLPSAGERLLSLRNTCVPDEDGGESMFVNGDMLEVVEDLGKSFPLSGVYHRDGETEVLQFSFVVRKLTLRWIGNDELSPVTIWVNITPIVSEEWRKHDKYAGLALYGAVVRHIASQHKGLTKEELQHRVRQSSLLRAPVVTYGYALTVHKAQGGEWDDVWVDYHFAQSQNTEEYYRWAYTATTRARKCLFAIQPPKLDDLLAALERGIERHAAAGVAEPGGPVETLSSVLSRYGLAVGRRTVQNWGYRVEVVSREDRQLTCGFLTVGYNGRHVVSHVLPRISGLTEDLLQDLRKLVGMSVSRVLELEPEGGGELVDRCTNVNHRRVVDRLKGAVNEQVQLTEVRSLTDHQLRVSIRTSMGDGYVDWYFDGKGNVSEMGTATVPLSALQLLRKALKE